MAPASLDQQLLESWDTHERMLVLLFAATLPEAFAGEPGGMTGRSVGGGLARRPAARPGKLAA